MANVFSRVKVDRNVYLDDWGDVVALLKKLEVEAQAAARDFRGREPSKYMPTPKEFAAMMASVAQEMGDAVSGLAAVEKRFSGTVELPER